MIKRNCVICEKEITAKRKTTRGLTGHSQETDSKEGTWTLLGGRTKWFCNDCWDKIIEYAKKEIPEFRKC